MLHETAVLGPLTRRCSAASVSARGTAILQLVPDTPLHSHLVAHRIEDLRNQEWSLRAKPAFEY